jgi:hypothetical protein
MKRLIIFSLICFLSGLMTIACERGVRAGREEKTETYQPRPAPREEATPGATTQQNQPMKGELTSVDMKNQTVTVRATNGMEQTFKVNDQTRVQGAPKAGAPVAVIQVRDLKGKEGSEVIIAWSDQAGAKTATNIDVTQPVNKGNTKTKTQGRY